MNKATNALEPSKTALPRRPLRRLAASCFAVFTIVATAAMPLPVYARAAPESFADLAEEVTGAVVNISASTTVEARNRTMPQRPPGTPFEDLFEEFFNRRGQGGQGGGPGTQGDTPRQRRSNSLGSGFVIDPSGIVVTNNHVIGDANDVSVIFSDVTRLKADIVGKDS